MNLATKFWLMLLLLQVVTTVTAITITNVAAGAYHSLFLKSDGSLWATGSNKYGQLGDGTTNDVHRPELIVSNGVTAIAAGYGHSLFLKSDGSLWGMGNNQLGQLGDGTTNNASVPEQIVSSGVVAIAAGGYHSLFLKSDGSLWAMGYNAVGQLGDGTTNDASVPEQIISSDVIAIAGGTYHSLFLKSNGSLWSMGDDVYGELGDGLNGLNVFTNVPEQIISSGVVAVAAGAYHSLFLKNDGSLWAAGNNQYGELGDGFSVDINEPEQIIPNGVVTIAAGWFHSLFVKTNGSLWAMGNDFNGQLGDGVVNFNPVSTPEQIISNGVTAIAGGMNHSLFLKSDGSVWSMGQGYNGQLGDGFNDSGVLVPEQIIPSPQPILTAGVLSQTNIQFEATCQFGGTFYLLASPELSQPLSQWIPIWTNLVAVRGINNFNVTISNAVNSDQQFYILQSK
ncbi:MAG TPA: RCC1 repeat- and reductase domain-containing protein [Verrucomicrobiae bacterium]|nr:RCC1 repeat- and reductase domain-containing protein [Verrucomicrobiae bacterium]